MEIDDLKGLIELLKDTDITELQIEKDGNKVKIRREKRLSSFELSRPVVAHEKPTVEPADDTQRLITVTSPIVGTFYRSASPETEPFVQTGARVKKGQVLCVIEAMKLMN
ncbi:MAG: biotin/lipoyl-containing protein, partial [Thermodesulfovibrionales bacterium]|nr:biotin/lipoyl-containing protein [Thermodesulfovibrionales bacterium]